MKILLRGSTQSILSHTVTAEQERWELTLENLRLLGKVSHTVLHIPQPFPGIFSPSSPTPEHFPCAVGRGMEPLDFLRAQDLTQKKNHHAKVSFPPPLELFPPLQMKGETNEISPTEMKFYPLIVTFYSL